MCKPTGNGTHFARCFEEAKRKLGTDRVPNRDMRKLLRDNGGCLVKAKAPAR